VVIGHCVEDTGRAAWALPWKIDRKRLSEIFT
jgi:hypothetical protein